MMDEPFGALDALTREQMRLDLEHLWLETKKTVLFITHSIDEAVLLSDRVVVMSPRPGRIETMLEIDLPRPRGLAGRKDPRFASVAELITEIFLAHGVWSRTCHHADDQSAPRKGSRRDAGRVRAMDAGAGPPLAGSILVATRIFLYGVGRNGLVLQAFAMRLVHLGLDAHFVGQLSAPPAGAAIFVVALALGRCRRRRSRQCEGGRSQGPRYLRPA